MIRQKVMKIIAKELSIEEKDVTLESDFENDLEIDSLGVLQLSTAIEEEFDIEIPVKATKKIKTVSDLVNLVVEKA